MKVVGRTYEIPGDEMDGNARALVLSLRREGWEVADYSNCNGKEHLYTIHDKATGEQQAVITKGYLVETFRTKDTGLDKFLIKFQFSSQPVHSASN